MYHETKTACTGAPCFFGLVCLLKVVGSRPKQLQICCVNACVRGLKSTAVVECITFTSRAILDSLATLAAAVLVCTRYHSLPLLPSTTADAATRRHTLCFPRSASFSFNGYLNGYMRLRFSVEPSLPELAIAVSSTVLYLYIIWHLSITRETQGMPMMGVRFADDVYLVFDSLGRWFPWRDGRRQCLRRRQGGSTAQI